MPTIIIPGNQSTWPDYPAVLSTSNPLTIGLQDITVATQNIGLYKPMQNARRLLGYRVDSTGLLVSGSLPPALNTTIDPTLPFTIAVYWMPLSPAGSIIPFLQVSGLSTGSTFALSGPDYSDYRRYHLSVQSNYTGANTNIGATDRISFNYAGWLFLRSTGLNGTITIRDRFGSNLTASGPTSDGDSTSARTLSFLAASYHRFGTNAVWNRALPDAELSELNSRFYGILQKKRQVTYFTTAGGGITGILSATVDDYISSIVGTTTIVGTIANTTENYTSNISGTPSVTGTISSTLADNTSTISGTVSIVGTISNTLEEFTSNISGSLGDAITGTIAVTIDDSNSTIAGTTAVNGTVSVTINLADASLEGTTTILGTITQQMQNYTSSIHGFIGDEDIQNRLRTLMGMGT